MPTRTLKLEALPLCECGSLGRWAHVDDVSGGKLVDPSPCPSKPGLTAPRMAREFAGTCPDCGSVVSLIYFYNGIRGFELTRACTSDVCKYRKVVR